MLQVSRKQSARKKQQSVKVLNPLSGHVSFMSLQHARKLVCRGQAKFDRLGQLEFMRTDPAVMKSGPLMFVSEFCGLDAFPGRPVMPPSPGVVARQSYYRGPVRPPVGLSRRSG